MVEKRIRKRIGLLYSYDENWIAGTYYIENLVYALNYLDDIEKPQIIIVSQNIEDFKRIKSIVDYPYLHFRVLYEEPSRWQKVLNRISREIIRVNLFDNRICDRDFDFLFPGIDNKFYFNRISKKVYWIPDLQDKFYPEYFKKHELDNRELHRKKLIKEHRKIVLSSNTVKKDFFRFYQPKEEQIYIIPFAVRPQIINISKGTVLKQYNLPKKYFYVPNQFWKHKNHIIVLKSLRLLKEKGVEVFVTFSGKDSDYRNPEYFNEIKKYVSTYKLNENVSFLGFIKRHHQLALMKYSHSIIQPSLFEGWSTVVEDCKSLNNHILISDIPVHREQIELNATFFNANDEIDLAKKMELIWTRKPELAFYDYKNHIKRFAKSFSVLLDSI